MTLSDFLAKLVEAFDKLPYAELQLTWHQHLSLWSAHLSCWSVREGLTEHPWGHTPEEAVRKLLSQLKGKTLHRSGPNGSWGSYTVTEEVTVDEVAFTAPKPPPPLRQGYNEVLRENALVLAEKADKIFLQTFLGQRPIKGYPEEKMIDADKGGKGFRGLLEWIRSQKEDCPIEVGVYDEGKELGFRGGLF